MADELSLTRSNSSKKNCISPRLSLRARTLSSSCSCISSGYVHSSVLLLSNRKTLSGGTREGKGAEMKFLGLILGAILALHSANSEIKESKKWEQDLTSNMKIGLATGGYSKAVLECSADWMAFVVSTEEPFKGVVYTRGMFHRQNSPCFLNSQGGTDFALKIPYDDCGVKRDSSLGGYTTTVIVQHDKELITPGDLGFTLICKDEQNVNASLQGMRSQINLVDPDPSEAGASSDGALSAMSPSHIVTLSPPKISLPSKEEL